MEDGDSGTEDEDDAAAAEEEELTPRDDADDGRQAHDEAVLKTIRGQAIRLMKDKGISISVTEENMALQLFPRVSVWFACGGCSNDVKAVLGCGSCTPCSRFNNTAGKVCETNRR